MQLLYVMDLITRSVCPLCIFARLLHPQGQGLVSGGLDALETLGKKTMEVLSEGDPGELRLWTLAYRRDVAWVEFRMLVFSLLRLREKESHAGHGSVSISVPVVEGGQG